MASAGSESTAWSYDGQYLSVATGSTPFIMIYKRTGDSFEKLPNPSVLPTGQVRHSSWTPDGQYLAVAHFESPFVTIYKRSGDTFTKVTNPDVLPTGMGHAADFTADGQYLAVGHYTHPFVTVYKRTGDTFTKVTNPDVLPPSNVNHLEWANDGTYLATAHSGSPGVTVYKRSGENLSRLSTPTHPLGVMANGASFSFNDRYLAFTRNAGGGTPYVFGYVRNGDTFDALPDFSQSVTGTGRDIAWAPNGQYMVVTHNQSPYFDIYKQSRLINPGEPLAVQNATASTTVESVVRLRQAIRNDNGIMSSTDEYRLQYAEKMTTCSSSSFSDVGSGAFDFYNHADLADRGEIAASVADPFDGFRTSIGQVYVESQPFGVSGQEVMSGQNALWDFSLVAKSVGVYCFRVVHDDGSELDEYLQYPEIEVLSSGPTLEQRMRGGQSVVDGVKSPLGWQ